MENIEHRAVLKYLCKKGMLAKQIFEDKQQVYQEGAPSYSMVKKWAALFKAGRDSIEDDPRAGRPITTTDDNHVQAMDALVLSDRRVTVSRIATELGISESSVIEILHEKLDLNKLSSRRVPKMLSRDNKLVRIGCSRVLLDR